MTKQSKPAQLAVVTGASSGIGYELARVFAENGFDLLVCAEGSTIHECGRQLRGLGREVETCQADLATKEGVQALYGAIRRLGRPVDALALNAGVGVSGKFAEETDLEEELNLIQLNVVSTVHLGKLVLKDMVARGQGRVLITSSIASTMPGPYYAIYAASKAFTQSFAEAIRFELKDSGVSVTSLMPGATDTAFFERAGMEDTKVGQAEKDDPYRVAKQGYDALMSGKDAVVAGSFANRLQAAAARVMPEPLKAAAQASQLKPAAPEKKESA